MNCPRCGGRPLALTPVREGLEIDACPSCGGVWLDKSEIYFYVAKPEQAYFIVAPEGAEHPWTEEYRLLRMSCDSVLTDPSEGPTLLDILAKLLGPIRSMRP
jgi:Zn-finger nucleic acid-binding protein